MPVLYTKKEQGKTITTGTGIPVHSAVAGDEYTDLTTGLHYIYITSWVVFPSDELQVVLNSQVFS